ncbi:aminoglycoside phosphotransferase family protein [Streptomyces sp. TRM66268-LWL]|uniref:Aminoglycoside phosphotransferase family protein n=1 Tax=Streptomyces polyasparticus TaxID=2767826 RepID=A0ABR7STJ3_9ACTN|nr:aminoglycoside phosphotransferase family protein [Streptomyces polyasparticus]MBC9718801.1 aminoglycoside phosphotransferase family protein [Streptomyces polyasparticus]
MDTGELLGSGRSADVFALDDRWVLRRYRGEGDASREGAFMAYLAERGYPVPRIRAAGADAGEAGSLRHTDLVMERLSGPSMSGALGQGALSAYEGGVMLAGLLRRLHEIPARLSPDPADRVLHLDLHPDNVMLTAGGPVVIDWGNVQEGPPGLDWAMSALILAQVAVVPGAESAGARAGLAALLEHRDRAIGLDVGDLGCMEQARMRRAADPNLTRQEIDALDEAVALVRELDAADGG